jgi:hypothetical protein
MSDLVVMMRFLLQQNIVSKDYVLLEHLFVKKLKIVVAFSILATKTQQWVLTLSHEVTAALKHVMVEQTGQEIRSL